jgi:hypothetical protein
LENYFNYFTEIEEQFLRRRGGGLLLTTLDWALIETWKDAGIPLEAVLRGIDAAFDRYDQRPSKSKKVNSLAYCSQEVLTAAEDMKEAAAGAATNDSSNREKEKSALGFEPQTILQFLLRNADQLERADLPSGPGISAAAIVREIAATLRKLAQEITAAENDKKKSPKLEDLERRLTVLEEKLFAALLTATPDDLIVAARAQADRELAAYRRKMTAPQIDQLQKQYVHKRLLEKYNLPRLSLFYM